MRLACDFRDETGALALILPDYLSIKYTNLESTHVTPLTIALNTYFTPLLPIPDVLIDGPAGDLRQEILANADTLVRTLNDYYTEYIETGM